MQIKLKIDKKLSNPTIFFLVNERAYFSPLVYTAYCL